MFSVVTQPGGLQASGTLDGEEGWRYFSLEDAVKKVAM